MNICGPVFLPRPMGPYEIWMIYNCETRKLRTQLCKNGRAIYEDHSIDKIEDILDELLQQ